VCSTDGPVIIQHHKRATDLLVMSVDVSQIMVSGRETDLIAVLSQHAINEPDDALTILWLSKTE
jgi:hypothetical protein